MLGFLLESPCTTVRNLGCSRLDGRGLAGGWPQGSWGEFAELSWLQGFQRRPVMIRDHSNRGGGHM